VCLSVGLYVCTGYVLICTRSQSIEALPKLIYVMVLRHPGVNLILDLESVLQAEIIALRSI